MSNTVLTIACFVLTFAGSLLAIIYSDMRNRVERIEIEQKPLIEMIVRIDENVKNIKKQCEKCGHAR